MSKQKKNANYQTDKKIADQAKKEEQKIKEKNAKTVKIAAICAGAVLAVVAIIVGILFAVGAFDYSPEPTYHATFNIKGYDSIHIELYGNDAPETVKNFITLAEEGFFDDRTFHTFVDGLLYGGSLKDDYASYGIKGEFSSNGFENNIPMKKGVLCMARGEDYNSAYGQFFVLTKNNKDIAGDYAAFGRITNLEVLKSILKNIEVDENGKVVESTAPRILSVTLHEAHH